MTFRNKHLARNLRVPGLETVEPLTLADGFDLSRRPGHLIVVGANRYALEFAQACGRLGIDTEKHGIDPSRAANI